MNCVFLDSPYSPEDELPPIASADVEDVLGSTGTGWLRPT